MGGCFNPLHCGAVVASHDELRLVVWLNRVSIPFIAGQWSLLGGGQEPAAAAVVFQSPSLRGSGRFSRRRIRRDAAASSFQSPSLRGSGRFARAARRPGRDREVSIPFIAGQWSLRDPLRLLLFRLLLVSIPFIAGQWSLLPAGQAPAEDDVVVSIPFIAGQWSLLNDDEMMWIVGPVSIPFIAGQWSLLPRTTPSSLFGVLLRKRRLPCDHIICTRLPF